MPPDWISVLFLYLAIGNMFSDLLHMLLCYSRLCKHNQNHLRKAMLSLLGFAEVLYERTLICFGLGGGIGIVSCFGFR